MCLKFNNLFRKVGMNCFILLHLNFMWKIGVETEYKLPFVPYLLKMKCIALHYFNTCSLLALLIEHTKDLVLWRHLQSRCII